MSSLACCGGRIDEGDPKGSTEVIGGINCYIGGKPDNTIRDDIAVIIASDVFGYTLPNVRLIADKFSRDMNAICVVPDLFEGSEPPASLLDQVESMQSPDATFWQQTSGTMTLLYYFPAFLIRNPKSKGVQRIQQVIKELRENRGIKKIALQGYCWGGSLAVILGSYVNEIDVFCSAHPGGFDIPTSINNLKIPSYFILTPDKDFQLKRPQCQQIVELLSKKENGQFKHKVKLYEQTAHGFAVRGDNTNPNIKSLREDAYQTTIEFFKEVLQV